MARAFSCVTLLPHYIGYVYVLYVNDLNRHARRSRAKISLARESISRVSTARARVLLALGATRRRDGITTQNRAQQQTRQRFWCVPFELVAVLERHGVIPRQCDTGLCSAGTGNAIESPGAAYRQSLPAWAMPPANASRNNFVFGPMGGGALVEDRRARRVREGMVSVRRGLM